MPAHAARSRSGSSPVGIVEFTDPGCPFAFSAEPHRLRLRWLFGDQLHWELHMVGLAKTRQDNTDKGLDPEMIAAQATGLAQRYGMPLYDQVREAVPATVPACCAVVGARVHAPQHEWPMLRRLRMLAMSGGMLDDPALIEQAASDVGIDAHDLRTWTEDDAVLDKLEEDLRLARHPTDAALALKGKLARARDGWRYTPPSYEFSAATTCSVPGIQSSLAYETAIANVAPHLERRAEPEDVIEVLRWAGYPLATQEVAEVCGITRADARDRLATAGAHQTPVARDGYWTAQ